VDARDFKKAFDSSPGPMPVWFGVPELQRVRANVQNAGEIAEGRNPRYGIDLTEMNDENTGENPQQIEVRRLRGAIFVGDEDRTGFSCVRLGKIERAVAGPSLGKTTIPPLLRMRAWPPLCAGTETLRSEIRNRSESLGADAQQRNLSFATGGPGDIENLYKLTALNELGTRFEAMANTPDFHPHDYYLLLCEAIGKLALWDDTKRPRELPPYDHDESGPIFEELVKYVRLLIDKMIPRDYEEVPFDTKERGFSVELKQDWLSPSFEMYLGMRTQLQHHEVEALFKQKTNFRLASPTMAEEVFVRRLQGLDFKFAGAVPNLPRSADLHFFRIARTPEYWPKVEQERCIAIRVSPQDMSQLSPVKLSLFVVKVRR
jgi:type VI secretion system protein ImpJ